MLQGAWACACGWCCLSPALHPLWSAILHLTIKQQRPGLSSFRITTPLSVKHVRSKPCCNGNSRALNNETGWGAYVIDNQTWHLLVWSPVGLLSLEHHSGVLFLCYSIIVCEEKNVVTSFVCDDPLCYTCHIFVTCSLFFHVPVGPHPTHLGSPWVFVLTALDCNWSRVRPQQQYQYEQMVHLLLDGPMLAHLYRLPATNCLWFIVAWLWLDACWILLY